MSTLLWDKMWMFCHKSPWYSWRYLGCSMCWTKCHSGVEMYQHHSCHHEMSSYPALNECGMFERGVLMPKFNIMVVVGLAHLYKILHCTLIMYSSPRIVLWHCAAHQCPLFTYTDEFILWVWGRLEFLLLTNRWQRNTVFLNLKNMLVLYKINPFSYASLKPKLSLCLNK